MQERGGGYAGMDIPEFYAMAEMLFTPEQAAVNNAMPRKPSSAKDIAALMGKDEKEVEDVLESMANSGLCAATTREGQTYYAGAIFMPGILEWQFMRGTATERDKRVAKAIDEYKKAHDAIRPPSEQKASFPGMRVITVDKMIEDENTVHTYHQVKTYIDRNDDIAVGTCYCRHKAALLGEDTHDMPNQVCMSFGPGSRFMTERLGARQVSKAEAMKILDGTEEAGLIHMARNVTDNITFMCNCDRWHCVAVGNQLQQPKPGEFFNSGFEPKFDAEACSACETCIDRCPASALEMSDDDLPAVDLDRCFGCAACATGCPSEAIRMVNKPNFPEPPKNDAEWAEAFKASRS